MEQAKSLKSQKGNPLATERVGKLILKFAIPSIISFLVSALYNIVDQIFIGQGVGMLGNAATNIAFPLSTICLAVALLMGTGSASNFNLQMGTGHKEKAGNIAGNGIVLMFISGIALCALVLLFLRPLMLAFGATPQILPYTLTYTGITAFGFPFLIVSTGCSHLIRADGNPTYSMACMLSGAIINTILDPLFIFTFDMGIAGGALATVIGQVVSCGMAVIYLFRFKTVHISKDFLRLQLSLIKAIVSLGAASFFNQLAMTVVNIVMNNTLRHYGSLSSYGSDIPLASVGVISKISVIVLAFVLGIAQGCQPITGYNYGAKNYARVKQTFFKAAVWASVISVVSSICFQLFPRQIIRIFGPGSDLYYQFAERYFRIFMLLIFINQFQPLTATFFTSIGKATRGIILSLTRQILFLLPLIVLFPVFMGIDGIMYAGPIADGAAALTAFILIALEMKELNRLIAQNKSASPSIDFIERETAQLS